MSSPPPILPWLDEVRKLPRERVFVQHNPPTPRYGRAQAKLGYLLEASTLVGVRPHETLPHCFEVAAWAPRPEGRGHGYYTCFRLFLERDNVTLALLFCFYDGTERSPGLRSLDAARELARSNGFEDTP